MNNDLTKGNPTKQLLRYCLPMVLSMVFQQLYNMVDSIIAGNMLGVDALAATSVSYPVTMIYLAVGTGGSVGCGVAIANYFGAGKTRELKSAISTTLITMCTVSLVLTLVGTLACEPITRMLNTPSEIFDDSNAYLKVYTYGIAFVFLYNACNAVFTGLGDSRTPLVLLVFSSLSNIGLDIIFARIRGVEGLAIATVIAQGAAAILAFILLLARLKKIKCTEKSKLFDWKILRHMSLIALPSICSNAFISVGQLCVISLINGFGSVTIAGYNSALKINTFCISTMGTMGNAVSNYVAQNAGAGEGARIKRGFWSANALVTALNAIFVVLVLTLAKQLVGLFVDTGAADGAAVVDVGRKFLTITCPFYFLVGIKLNCDGVMRGTGKMMLYMVSTLVDLVLRVAFSYILVPHMGFDGIGWSFPIGWVIGTAMAAAFYFFSDWRKKVALLTPRNAERTCRSADTSGSGDCGENQDMADIFEGGTDIEEHDAKTAENRGNDEKGHGRVS